MSKKTVNEGPLGAIIETTAKTSVIAPASKNQRFRLSRLIRVYHMDEPDDSQIAFGS